MTAKQSKKRMHHPIKWFKEDSSFNLGKNVMLAWLYAEDGHPEAAEFLHNMKVIHLEAILRHSDDIIAGEVNNFDGGSREMLKVWLKRAKIESGLWL